MNERRVDDHTRDRIGAIAEAYEIFSVRVGWILRGLVLLTVAMAIGFTVVLVRQGDVAEEGKELAQQVQQDRIDTVIRDCKGRNARNLNAKEQARLTIDGGERLEIANLLIDAILPVRNCTELAAEAALPAPTVAPPRGEP